MNFKSELDLLVLDNGFTQILNNAETLTKVLALFKDEKTVIDFYYQLTTENEDVFLTNIMELFPLSKNIFYQIIDDYKENGKNSDNILKSYFILDKSLQNNRALVERSISIKSKTDSIYIEKLKDNINKYTELKNENLEQINALDQFNVEFERLENYISSAKTQKVDSLNKIKKLLLIMQEKVEDINL